MNVIGWERRLHNLASDGYLGGVTLTRVQRGKTVEADIALTPQEVRTVDEIRFVLMHEFGHAIGLNHDHEAGALMSAVADPNADRPASAPEPHRAAALSSAVSRARLAPDYVETALPVGRKRTT